LVYRNLLLVPFLRKGQLLFGVFVTSLLFSLSHLYIVLPHFYLNWVSYAGYFFLGVSLSLIRVRYGLLFSLIGHIVYNILAIGYSEKIIDLYLLDYIENKGAYWSVYLSGVVVIIYCWTKMYKHAVDSSSFY